MRQKSIEEVALQARLREPERVIVQVVWRVEDVMNALEDRYEKTPEEERLTLQEAIDLMDDLACDLEERSIERGWEVIEEALSDAEHDKEQLLHQAQVAFDERGQ